MPAEAVRKIMKHGCSRVVALPLDYLRYYKLNHGGDVRVFYDDILVILPKNIEIRREKRKLIGKIVGWGK